MKKRLVAAAMLLSCTAPAMADDFLCERAVKNRTIDDNVIVPDGAFCVLVNTYVKGNVELEDLAQLVVRKNTYIEGSIQTDGASRVRVRDSQVNGNIQLTGVDYNLASLVINSQIDGTVDWEGNDAKFLIRYSDIDSDIKVNQNNQLARIFDNRVGGNLQCQENEPRPRGGRNVVGGNKEDQCRRF